VNDLMQLLQDVLIPGVPIAEKILRPVLVYAFLVVLLRLAGVRTLSQMNAFDLVVLLTLSNTVQNAIIGNDNSVLGGMIGAATLVALNVAVVRYLYRHQALDRRIEGEPIRLVDEGRFVRANLEKCLITEDELMAAIRRQGASELEEVRRVILETSGAISVLLRHPTPEEAAQVALAARLERIEALLARLEGSVEGRGGTAT
jgi:uncharacterized membrane protein YcaP (DUF421 family)